MKTKLEVTSTADLDKGKIYWLGIGNQQFEICLSDPCQNWWHTSSLLNLTQPAIDAMIAAGCPVFVDEPEEVVLLEYEFPTSSCPKRRIIVRDGKTIREILFSDEWQMDMDCDAVYIFDSLKDRLQPRSLEGFEFTHADYNYRIRGGVVEIESIRAGENEWAEAGDMTETVKQFVDGGYAKWK